jgi:hypothetical protein
MNKGRKRCEGSNDDLRGVRDLKCGSDDANHKDHNVSHQACTEQSVGIHL